MFNIDQHNKAMNASHPQNEENESIVNNAKRIDTNIIQTFFKVHISAVRALALFFLPWTMCNKMRVFFAVAHLLMSYDKPFGTKLNPSMHAISSSKANEHCFTFSVAFFTLPSCLVLFCFSFSMSSLLSSCGFYTIVMFIACPLNNTHFWMAKIHCIVSLFCVPFFKRLNGGWPRRSKCVASKWFNNDTMNFANATLKQSWMRAIADIFTRLTQTIIR